MSVLAQTFTALSRGVPSNRIGATLGIDNGVAQACVDHLIRLGMVTPSGMLSLGCTACQTKGQARQERPPSCRGCPFSR